VNDLESQLERAYKQLHDAGSDLKKVCRSLLLRPQD
jgi:hypothetical protein